MGALAWLSACPSPPVDITPCPSRATDIFWPKLVQVPLTCRFTGLTPLTPPLYLPCL